MIDSTSPHAGPLVALRRFLDVPFRAQTYRNLAYLALAFPLGVAYFVGVTTGLSLGLGMLVTLVGLPILVLTLAAATLAAGFEATLAQWLLDLDVTPPQTVATLDTDRLPTDAETLLDGLARFLTTPTTWTSLLLVVLKFGLGIVAVVALTTFAAVVAALVTAPLFYDVPGLAYHVGPYVVDTEVEGAAVGIAGLLAFFVGLHLLNGLARLFGIVTATLLGQTDDYRPETPNDR